MNKLFNKLDINRSLSMRVLSGIITASAVITIFITVFQLYNDYRSELSLLDRRLEVIEESYLKSLAIGIWDVNEQQISNLLEGIVTLQDIEYVLLKTSDKTWYSSGNKIENNVHKKSYNIDYKRRSNSTFVGELVVFASLDGPLSRIKEKFWIVFFVQMLRTIAISFCILFLFKKQVLQYTLSISNFFQKEDYKNFKKLDLGRSYKINDEVTHLEVRINNMVDRLKSEFKKRDIAERELKNLNNELESRVLERTYELKEALIKLEKYQDRLVTEKKQESLSLLMTGLVKKINSPLKILNDANSFTDMAISQMKEDIANNKEISDIDKLKAVSNVVNTAIINTQKISGLVESFATQERTSGNTYKEVDLSEILEKQFSRAMQIERANYDFICKTVQLNHLKKVFAYSEELEEVFLNLFRNAIYSVLEESVIIGNGFKPEIFIGTRDIGNDIEIFLRDNGVGISSLNKDKIFTPFFSTRPSHNGSGGLGLSQVYDIIVKKHDGEVLVNSNVGEFAEFIIRFPRKSFSSLSFSNTSGELS